MDRRRGNVCAITFALSIGLGFAAPAIAMPPSDYAANLALIKSATPRNTNHDDSPWRNTPQADLVIENHLGPREEYLGNPAGSPEGAFPDEGGGQFRGSCEFSHFSYDDPLVHPGKPGAAHLHMYWGNTDANAYSNYNTLINSGSSTCNGQELNRTAYWAPAMFDGELLIDNWTDHPPTTDYATVDLVSGKAHAIAVQYYQRWGQSLMRLGWTRSNGVSAPIARRFLFPEYPF